ncbi:MAG TPA: TIGR00303 family protein [Methanosarcinales archaeon]|nr:TIGR00303 family protein [Methanosarcinales archaeon]
MEDILIANNKKKSSELIEELRGLTPIFECTIATTQTAKIQGISAAGAYPEITDYTPPADVELLFYGKCKCISGVPVTPDGIPTPALITRSALELAEISTFVVNAGLNIKPYVPFMEVGGKSGESIVTGKAVSSDREASEIKEVFERSVLLGKELAKTADYLVMGESIPGGTTTALAVLLALGIDAEGKVSSSMPNNPHDIKIDTVNKAMKSAQITKGALKDSPLSAISKVGDPMQVVHTGIAIGAKDKIPVMLAGGTQMAAILALIDATVSNTDNIFIGTTKWIIEDKTSDLKGLVNQIADIPILAANLDFSAISTSNQGLQKYEEGTVKEGVGAGGASIAAMLRKGEINKEVLLKRIKQNYEKLIN